MRRPMACQLYSWRCFVCVRSSEATVMMSLSSGLLPTLFTEDSRVNALWRLSQAQRVCRVIAGVVDAVFGGGWARGVLSERKECELSASRGEIPKE